MIFNTQIKNGFAVINRDNCMYFSLISAGGIINVKLTNKGKTVLDTKFWVGMSIDQAIQFDEIILTGDDGLIEFWAGQVSMNQAVISTNAARSINTKEVFAMGKTQISDSNYLRMATRVRPSKNIKVGGAGVQGWTVAAGETVEFPVAGVLYALSEVPIIDFVDKVQVVENGFYPSPFSVTFENYAEDGSFSIASGSTFCGVQINTGAGFTEHPDFLGSYDAATNLGDGYHGCKSFDGTVWVARVPNQSGVITLFKSVNEGLTFQQVMQIQKPAGWNNSASGSLLIAINRTLTINAAYHAIIIDIDSLNIEYIDHLSAVLVCGDGKRLYKSEPAPSGFKSLMVSENGGSSWRELVTDIRVSPNLNPIFSNETHICVEYGFLSNQWGLSDDKGESFSGNIYAEYTPKYFGAGWWVHVYGGALKASRVNGGAIETVEVMSGYSGAYDLSVSPSGLIVSISGVDRVSVQIDVNGSLLPTKIEVMELLS